MSTDNVQIRLSHGDDRARPANNARVPGKGSRSTLAIRRNRRGIPFILPFMVMFVLFLIVPLGYAIYESLFTTKLAGGTSFTGAANYASVLTDSKFWSSVRTVLIYAVIQVPIVLVLAFLFANFFDLGVVKFGRILRTIFFIPFAIPSVVASVMWAFLLDPTGGPYTQFVEALGFPHTNFFSPALILPSIIVISIWAATGYNMIIMYTSLQAVPQGIVEAALLDGASLWRVIFSVKLPMIRSSIVMLVFLDIIGASQLFTEPLILSYFQPQSISTNFTPTLYIYNLGVSGGQYGLAAAAAVILGALVVLISVASLALRRRNKGVEA
jgi:multiple sugar transport system permease protein